MATHDQTADAPNTPRTIPALLLADEAQAPDVPALVTEDARVTYAELAAAARAFAAGLIASGVRRGDRVAVWLPNGADWLTVHWAAALAGAILVPLSTRNRPAEVEYILRQSGAATLVLQDRFLQIDYLAALPALLAAGLPELHTVIVRQTIPDGGALPAPAIAWDEAIRRGAQTPGSGTAVAAATAAVTPSDVHVLQYTSGSTGYPKGAMLTHDGLIHSAGHHAATWDLHAGDAILVPNPMSHILGLIFAVLMPAITRVIPISVPTFDPEQVLRLVQRERPVVLLGTPTHFQMLAEHPRLADYDISSLRLGMAGGAASTPETVRRLTERLGLEALINGLGSSEAGSVAHTAPGDPPEIHATTCGRPMPWLETRIVDPQTGADQPDGQPGELWIRGPGVMKGYFRNPEATAAALTPDGWLRTGDLLLRGEDGCLRFTGRLKEMFTVGGFNVYPAEVERVLAQHPAVAECQVLGVPDARLGAVPFAFVRFQPDASESLADAGSGRPPDAPTDAPPQSPPARAGDRADAVSASASGSPSPSPGVGAGHVPPAGSGGEDSVSVSASSASSAVPLSSPSPLSSVPSVSSVVNSSEDDLRAFCAERLANYKVPRYFHILESFPLTGTGKRELRVLHEMAEAQVAAAVAQGAQGGRQ